MPLPLTRDETCTPNSPVRSHLLNAIQDAIVQLYRDQSTIVIPGAAFVPRNPNYATTVQAFIDDWQFLGGPPNNVIVAPLFVPAGRHIESITWHLNKAGSASAMTLSLHRRNGAASSNVDTVNDSTSGAAYTTNVRAIDYTVAAGDALHLIVEAGSTVHRFSHAILNLT